MIKRNFKKTIRRFAGLPRLTLTLFVTLLLAGTTKVTAGSAPASHIERIGLKEGLSNSEVRCIYQDRHGFLWFGTYDGLNRYDGFDFRVYRNKPENAYSIVHSYVNCITEDFGNNIWAGTRQGVSKLNPLTEKFTTLTASQGTNTPFQIRSYVRDIIPGIDGAMYVASLGNGLIVFDKESNNGHVIPLKIQATSPWSYDVDAILKLSNGKIYLMIAGVGLCEFDPSKRSIHLINPTVTICTSLYQENSGLWVGTTQGLYYFNLHTKQYERLLNEANTGFRSNRITSMQSMPDGSLWVGTDGGGIQVLDKERKKLTYLSAGSDEQSLSSDAVYALYLDKAHRKWIGTLRGGINVIDDIKNRFQNIHHDPLNPNSLISNFVKSVYEDRDGKIWIGTDGGGLSVWDRGSNTFSNFHHEQKTPGALTSNYVTGIIQDATGKIWIATYGGGINLFLPEQHKFKTYFGLKIPGKDSGNIFWCFLLDHAGNLWASGLQDGLFIYDSKNDCFKLYDPKLSNILSLCEDAKGNIWGGEL